MRGRIGKVLNKLFRFMMRWVGFAGAFLLPVNRKLVFFESYLGNSYSGNPKYIYQTLLSEIPELKCVWSFSSEADLEKIRLELPGNPIVVKKFSLLYYFYFVRAGFLINNSRFPRSMTKNSRSVYIQTWHGTPLKKLVLDQQNVQMRHALTKEQYHQSFLDCRKRWDYLLSQNRFSTEVFKTAFAFEGEILETGYPRNQVLFLEQPDRESKKEEVRKQLGIPSGKKVLLYAPTFRDNKHSDHEYYMDVSLDFDRLYEALNGEYCFLTRFHYLVSKEYQSQKDFVFDVSGYSDISELILVSDILITDYSSVFFDYANTDKPIYFYMDDIEEYRDNMRGFYLDINTELPGPVCATNSELIEEVKKNSFPKEKYEEFKRRFTYLDSENCCAQIIEIINRGR